MCSVQYTPTEKDCADFRNSSLGVRLDEGSKGEPREKICTHTKMHCCVVKAMTHVGERDAHFNENKRQ